MNRSIAVISILVSSFCCIAMCNAQRPFQEGILVYNVTIDPPAGDEGINQYTGTYTITVKGGLVRKDLKLENGFENILVTDYGGRKAFSLKKMGNTDVAIQVDMAKLEQRKKKYENFNIRELNNTRQVASLNAKECTLIYPDNSSLNIFYNSDWQLTTDIFEHFPGIKLLPVIFAYTGDEGRVTHFTLQRIEAVPVENSVFAIPAHAKVISAAEYEELKRK